MDRKSDHIQMATHAQNQERLSGIQYEPMFSAHPNDVDLSLNFLGKKMNFPIWISSMTGGTAQAKMINRNLALAAREYGLGMGLGSCRVLLEEGLRREDFDLREVIGDQPFFANLGIAQVENYVLQKKVHHIRQMVDELKCDGLIIHVNPLQEWLQTEGDRLQQSPADTIKNFLNESDIPVVVKEVGQGMGPKSLEFLLSLPIAAIELAGFGGTNFSKLELARHAEAQTSKKEAFEIVADIGHTSEEMITWINDYMLKTKKTIPGIIVSGGIKNFLDGFKLMGQLNTHNVVYGQGFELMKRAQISYEVLQEYLSYQIEGLKVARAFFNVKKI